MLRMANNDNEMEKRGKKILLLHLSKESCWVCLKIPLTATFFQKEKKALEFIMFVLDSDFCLYMAK